MRLFILQSLFLKSNSFLTKFFADAVFFFAATQAFVFENLNDKHNKKGVAAGQLVAHCVRSVCIRSQVTFIL